MTITFSKLLSDILIALADNLGATWSRAGVVTPWAEEAMLSFPILRPQQDDHVNGASVVYSYDAPTDFREVVSIEYPVAHQPPTYLVRKNHLDPNFYDSEGYYDIDHDYASGTGWQIFVSGGIAAAAHIKMNYLANHEVGLADDYVDLITVPDEYENILIAYCVTKAFRERLGKTLQDPTAHTSVILQMTEMTKRAEDAYVQLASTAQERLATSRITPNITVDKYDRLY